MLFLLRSAFKRRVMLLALLGAWSLLMLFPEVTQAHAILLRSDPAKDAVLTSAPSQVRMWFTEALNPTFSSAVVVNTANQRVDTNNAHVASDPTEMDISLRSGLSAGVYVVVWRTQSADDGHVLRGSFLFKVAQADGTVPGFSGTLPGQDQLGGGSTSADASGAQLDGPTWFNLIMITLVELGVVFWVGAQLWRSFVLQLADESNQEQRAMDQSAEQRFVRFFALPVLLVLLLANIGVLVGQGLSITGGQLGQALAPSLLSGLISSGRFGTYWIMRQIVILLSLIVAIYMFLSRQRSRIVESALSWINLVLGLALLIAITLSGHAASVTSNLFTLAVLGDWLHLLAAALWVGGMMYLSAVYLPALKGSLIERTRALLTTLPRFSPLALSGVAIMAISGPFNAVVHMASFDQLFTTAYGRALVVKVLLVAAMLVTSAIHVRLFRPRLAKTLRTYTAANDQTRGTTVQEEESNPPVTVSAQEIKQLESSVAGHYQRLTRTLRWEPLLGVAVLVCVGLMNVFAGTLQPTVANPAQQQQGTPVKPFTTTVKTTDNQFTINLTVSPNRFGTNVFTVSVLDSHGAPDTRVGVSIYTTMLDMDMGTDTVNLQPDGKGHFSAQGDLSMSGNWKVRIEIRTVESTLHEATVKMLTPF